MPSINYDPIPLDDEDKLWALFTTLRSRGWVGSIGAGAEDHSPAEDAPVVTKLDMHGAGDASADGILGTDGTRRLQATVGDVRVDTGNTEPKAITAMTPAAFTAMYGGTA